MQPSVLNVAVRLNSTFRTLCSSQDLWRKLCVRRWNQSVPQQVIDYHRHYMQRSAMEDHTTTPTQCDRANWGMHLLVQVLDGESRPVHTATLCVRDATTEHFGTNMALTWRLPSVTNSKRLGACFLWSSDHRMCQLTPARERQDPKCIDDGDEEWTYTQTMNIKEGLHLNKSWDFYDGGCGELKLSAQLNIEQEYEYESEEEGATGQFSRSEIGDGAVLMLRFLSEDDEGEFSSVPLDSWPDVFRILPWGLSASDRS